MFFFFNLAELQKLKNASLKEKITILRGILNAVKIFRVGNFKDYVENIFIEFILKQLHSNYRNVINIFKKILIYIVCKGWVESNEKGINIFSQKFIQTDFAENIIKENSNAKMNSLSEMLFLTIFLTNCPVSLNDNILYECIIRTLRRIEHLSIFDDDEKFRDINSDILTIVTKMYSMLFNNIIIIDFCFFHIML